jgi:hypothetical protein
MVRNRDCACFKVGSNSIDPRKNLGALCGSAAPCILDVCPSFEGHVIYSGQ